MTTQQIQYFLQLADELHYWRTSYKVNITQSVLSRQIRALEEELQVELFKRTNRKVELTPAGRFLQQQWKPLLEQVNAAIQYSRKIQQGAAGSIIINHPGSITHDLLPDLLAGIAATFPDIKVELMQLKHTQEIELLKSFEVDLCYSRHCYDEDFVQWKLIRHDPLALAVPVAHPVQQLSDVSAASLQQERFILPTLTNGEVYQTQINQLFIQYGIVPNIRFESDFGSMILSLVEKGLGVSIIPFSYSLARHAGVRFIPLPFEVPLYLHWRRAEDNPMVTNILQLLLPD